MIISKQKSISAILDLIKKGPVFIIGCNQCAALCHTGGEPEVLEMKKTIERQNISVTGWIILDPACHLLNSKRQLKSLKDEINAAEYILTLSCGNGVQVIKKLFPEKTTISGTNTMFLGAETKRGIFTRECNLCGSCIIDEFEGFCPVSQCPKQMLNGPCGGSMNGKCELYGDLDCVWDAIIQKKMKDANKKVKILIVPPKDWTRYELYNWRTNDGI
jgi:ferredoxin